MARNFRARETSLTILLLLSFFGASALAVETSEETNSVTSSTTDSVEVSSTTENPKPRCPGTCHGSVMSLFCEHVDTAFACSDGEYCCIRRPTTPAPTIVQPEMPDCKGFCIPYFLSGLCYRPARLILKTSNCEQETLCCDNSPVPVTTALPDDSENEMRRVRYW